MKCFAVVKAATKKKKSISKSINQMKSALRIADNINKASESFARGIHINTQILHHSNTKIKQHTKHKQTNNNKKTKIYFPHK